MTTKTQKTRKAIKDNQSLNNICKEKLHADPIVLKTYSIKVNSYLPNKFFGVNLSLSSGSDCPALFSALILTTYSVPSVRRVNL